MYYGQKLNLKNDFKLSKIKWPKIRGTNAQYANKNFDVSYST